MLYSIKANTVRRGANYTHKFMLCNKRVPQMGYIFSKLGYLNNSLNYFGKRVAFFNLKKLTLYSDYGYKMNRAAYKHLGLLFGGVTSKKRRHY